jgi:hypothetical protein
LRGWRRLLAAYRRVLPTAQQQAADKQAEENAHGCLLGSETDAAGGFTIQQADSDRKFSEIPGCLPPTHYEGRKTG